MTVPVVDRATCEHLFSVRRRRAIDLMQRFGGYRAGNAVLLDRQKLIRQLQELACHSDVQQEYRRKERLSENLSSLRKFRIARRIPVNCNDAQNSTVRLPAGVVLQCGHLTVEFCRMEDLLAHLYTLSQALAADFEGFARLLEPNTNSSLPTSGPSQ